MNQAVATSARSPANVAMNVKALLSLRSPTPAAEKMIAITITSPRLTAIATSTPARPRDAVSGQRGSRLPSGRTPAGTGCPVSPGAGRKWLSDWLEVSISLVQHRLLGGRRNQFG